MRSWVTSDTHFSHARILRFRPEFQTTEQMDRYIVRRWNAVVAPDDEVYHLGDVAGDREGVSVVLALNGRKHLVLGNHDAAPMGAFLSAGFLSVRGSHVVDRLLLTHFPVHEREIYKADVNVHGHIHASADLGWPYYNVSIDATSYRPVSLDTISAWARAQQQDVYRQELSR